MRFGIGLYFWIGYGGWKELNLFLTQAYAIKTQTSAASSPAFLPTTLSPLDEALHGGVACRALTEVKDTLSKPSSIGLLPSERGGKVQLQNMYFMDINLNEIISTKGHGSSPST